MHLMIDLETLGTDPVTAPIVQIAAVPFTLDGDGPANAPTFQMFVSAQSNEAPPYERRINSDTLLWWLKTNPALLTSIMDPTRGIGLTVALIELAGYIQQVTAGDVLEGIWANGPTFDLAMLAAAFKQTQLTPPWNFRVERCCRTVFDIAGDNQAIWDGGTKTAAEQGGLAHNAIIDCYRQLRVIQQTYQQQIVPLPTEPAPPADPEAYDKLLAEASGPTGN